MKKIITLLFLVISFFAKAQISITNIATPYNQDFNTLATTGTTNTTLPSGWIFSETGSNANTSYATSTGSATAGDTYSFGATSNTERAFGGQRSGSLVPIIGAQFTNNTSLNITSFTLNYTGEQWRLGATGRNDRINFEYSVNATSLTSGTWIPNTSLDFIAPVSTGTTGPLNGNAAANRTVISPITISGLNIAAGASFFIRWVDVDATSSDDGLGIDDLTITFTGGVDNTPPTINTLTPTNNATNVAINTNLQILFSEPIAKGTGDIEIWRVGDPIPTQTIAVTDPAVTVGGSTATITINPLLNNTNYYVLIPASGTFVDLATIPNPFAGISSNTTWTFTTVAADVTPPSITTLTPTNNATNVSITTNLTALFNEQIVKGAGNIIVKRISDNSIVQTIDVNNVLVTITGGNTLNIDINDLNLGTSYYVEIDAGAVRDLSANNFAGITGNSAWNFTTLTAPAAGIIGNNYSFTNCTTTFLNEGWRQISILGPQTWSCTTAGRTSDDGIRMSGVTSGVFSQNEDWLISPPYDLTSVTNPTLKFYSKAEFIGNPLELYILLGYTTGSNPNTATQVIPINGYFPAVNTNSWKLSDNIDLSAYNQANVYVAWKYTSTTTTSTRWTIDDVTLYSAIVLPPCDEPTDQPTNLTLTPTATTVTGSFTAAVPAPSGYLVVRSTSSTLSSTPVDGTSYTIGNPLGGGTVIANTNSTTFVDNGLSPNTLYYYFVFAYNNENCTGGANYNVTLNSPNGNTNNTTTLIPAPCVEPSLPPTNLNLTATNTTISGTFTASGTANRYLVVITSTPPISATPADGTTYTAGSAFGTGTVVSYASSTTFTATGLTANTPYSVYIFAANGDCTGEPDYLITSLDGTINTTNGTGVPTGYYDAATGLTCQPLKTALKNIISTGTQVLSYTPGLWNLYPFSDKRRNDANTADILWDTYTDIPTGPEVYTFTLGPPPVTGQPGYQCGTYSNEGDCYNREHSTPQSWFQELSPMVSDAHHIFPTDGKINALHSNFPYGEVQTLFNPSAFNPSTNGSKLGSSPSENFGYTGTVFEPIDEYKGDYARAFLYMAVRYEDEMISQNWPANGTADSAILSATNQPNAAIRRLQFYDDWYIKLLFKWHIQDPVSAKEIARNNVIFSQPVLDGASTKVQGNRNPFIDHPEYAAAIWGPSCLSVLPVNITNLSAKKVNNNAVVNWSVSTEVSIVSYDIERSTNGINFEKIGQVIASNKSSYTFTDNNLPTTSRSYYRIKANEFSGKVIVTNIVSVDGNVNNTSIKVFPNPAVETIRVQLNSTNTNGVNTITITDIAGKIVVQRNSAATQNNIIIPVQHLSNGTYTLKVTNNNTSVNTKFVIAK